jgi:hypothetical protein
MSKYVDKKNGLTIGSNNMFFIIDRADDANGEPAIILPEGVADFRDGYNSIVSIESYRFAQVNSLTVFIKTPAQQLVWSEQTLDYFHEQEINGKTYVMTRAIRYAVLSSWAENWLNTNVGAKYKEWDIYTRMKMRHNSLFFKKRTHALAFCNEINKMLEGIAL